MPEAKITSDQRLTLIVETQREIATAGDELQSVMQLIAERSQAITGAQGSMVNLVDGEMLHARGDGIAVKAFDARRPIAGSVARYAIESGLPVLVEDAPNDPRINQELRAKLGDECLICVPLSCGSDVIGTLNVMSRIKVTESSMLANPTRAKTILTELSELGIRLSIDDFGTGYSSLSYLRQLPVDEIKIDRSFVMNMGAEADDAVIVRSTVDLGRNLGLDVVAEGVESLELWNRLRDLGCNIAQGYYLSRPLPSGQLRAWLQSRRPEAEAA